MHAPDLSKISANDTPGVQDEVYGQQQHDGSFTHEALAVIPLAYLKRHCVGVSRIVPLSDHGKTF